MSAKGKDTTKTAHVMNLLRKNTGPAPPAEPAEPHQSAPQAEPPGDAAARPLPMQHPIITSLNEEAAVSLEIKDALEQELLSSEPAPQEEELPPPAPEAEAAPPVLPDPVAAEPPLWAPEELEEAAEAAQPEEAEPPAPPEAAAIPAPPEEAETPMTPEAAEAPAPEMYNVMQLLVEQTVEKYLTMFGLCTCPRCRADVCALALSSLQPKYVVMAREEYVPRMTRYERQFNATVTAQILRACMAVAETPRHGAENGQ